MPDSCGLQQAAIDLENCFICCKSHNHMLGTLEIHDEDAYPREKTHTLEINEVIAALTSYSKSCPPRSLCYHPRSSSGLQRGRSHE